MEIIFVAAMSENHVIGLNGRIPWHLPNDLKRFRALTLNKHVLMGRKTFSSIGRALPMRHNLVLTRDPTFFAENVEVIASKEDLFRRDFPRVFVIGGEEIYRLFWSLCHKIYLTLVHTTLAGDAFFPEIHGFTAFAREDHDRDARHAFRYSFIDYMRESR
jgi:dihydrofolate reductase